MASDRSLLLKDYQGLFYPLLRGFEILTDQEMHLVVLGFLYIQIGIKIDKTL